MFGWQRRKRGKEKESLKEKGRDIIYAEWRWMLQKSLKLWDCCCNGLVKKRNQTREVEDIEFPGVSRK